MNLFLQLFDTSIAPYSDQEYQTMKTDFLQQLFDQKHIVMCLDMVNSSFTYFPGFH